MFSGIAGIVEVVNYLLDEALKFSLIMLFVSLLFKLVF